jgi:hypothetical protein
VIAEIVGLATVGVTAVYAFLTYLILRANRATVESLQEQNVALMRPYLVVSAGPHPGSIVVVLRIVNSGRSPAENVRLSIDRAFHQFGRADEGSDLRSLHAFSNPITMLPPGTELAFHLGSTIQVLGEHTPGPMPTEFNVSAAYQFGGRSYFECTTIDLKMYLKAALLKDSQTTALEQIAKEIANAAK